MIAVYELWLGENPNYYQLIMGTLKDSEFHVFLIPQYFQAVINFNHCLEHLHGFKTSIFVFYFKNTIGILN